MYGSTRPRVLFVAPSAYPLGGVQAWLDYILEGLPAHGWDTHLALVSGRFHQVPDYLAKHPFAPAAIVSAPTGTRRGRIDALRDCCLRVRPDVVVGVNIADIYAAVEEARASGAPPMRAVATLHGLQADFLADFAASRNILDAVISTNRLAQRLVIQIAGVNPERSLYAPYGVANVRRDTSSSDRSLNSGVLRLVYAGRIEEDQKRVSDLPRIVAAARQKGTPVELVVAGDGPDLESLRAQSHALGLDRDVGFLGVLGPEQMISDVYSRCDALIITSTWETGPIVAWEAMAAGVPVITSRYVGHRAEAALVHDVNCLMFDIGDIDGAVAGIVALSSGETRERIAAAALDLVEERYTIASSVAQWNAQLTKVLATPKRSAARVAAASPDGRLDRLLGAKLGERIRRLLNRSYVHHEPGGEWPHAYGVGALTAGQFRAEALRLDQSGQLA